MRILFAVLLIGCGEAPEMLAPVVQQPSVDGAGQQADLGQLPVAVDMAHAVTPTVDLAQPVAPADMAQAPVADLAIANHSVLPGGRCTAGAQCDTGQAPWAGFKAYCLLDKQDGLGYCALAQDASFGCSMQFGSVIPTGHGAWCATNTTPYSCYFNTGVDVCSHDYTVLP